MMHGFGGALCRRYNNFPAWRKDSRA